MRDQFLQWKELKEKNIKLFKCQSEEVELRDVVQKIEEFVLEKAVDPHNLTHNSLNCNYKVSTIKHNVAN